MAKVIFGNHSSVLVPLQDRDSIYVEETSRKILESGLVRKLVGPI